LKLEKNTEIEKIKNQYLLQINDLKQKKEESINEESRLNKSKEENDILKNNLKDILKQENLIQNIKSPTELCREKY
jgi:hypothetical protein